MLNKFWEFFVQYFFQYVIWLQKKESLRINGKGLSYI